jgi:3-hydroxymyristoyl/3-hydroxydecanoyl-(acyl carrier protein) dehydratase
MSAHESSFAVGRDHPSFAGHFPGNPLVPGVLLLERTLECAEAKIGRPLSVSAIVQAKFVAPLKPDELAQVELRHSATELRFAIRNAGRLIAQGVFALAPPP